MIDSVTQTSAASALAASAANTVAASATSGPGTSPASPADPAKQPTANSAPDATSKAASAAQPPAQPGTRLLVETNGDNGFVYQLVDSTTGRLLMELPRSQAAQLSSDPDYSAGDIVSRSV